jgi:hypothetical protein
MVVRVASCEMVRTGLLGVLLTVLLIGTNLFSSSFIIARRPSRIFLLELLSNELFFQHTKKSTPLRFYMKL